MEVSTKSDNGKMQSVSMSELEDGELESDDEPVIISCTSKNRPTITYDKENDKLQMRAKRFGLQSEPKRPVLDDWIQRLHDSMGVNSKTRTEALHLYGTDNMQTQDVFVYFDNHIPASVEWITEKSCNVVWLDQESCAKALLKHSITIRGQPVTMMDCDDDNDEDEDTIHVDDLRSSLPPGGVWRKGRARSNAPNLLIRFATFSDKKGYKPVPPEDLVMKSKLFLDQGDESVKKTREEEGANPWSGIARQWGNFDRVGTTRGDFGRTPRSPTWPPQPSVADAREVIKQKELRENLIKRDARDLLSYNKICRLEQELDVELIPKSTRPRSRGRDSVRPFSSRRHLSDDERESDFRDKRKRSPSIEENLQIIVENDIYKKQRKRRRASPPRVRVKSEKETEVLTVEDSSSSSSESSSSSSSDSSSSSSSSSDEDDDEELMKKSSGDLRHRWKQSSTPFQPSSPLRIEIDNDMYHRRHRDSD